MSNYSGEALAGATGVELIVALYDGWIRFLYRAAQAIDQADVHERRYAVKRSLDIAMYLQARLRLDIGGKPAAALSDFYSAMFTQTLEASYAECKEDMLNVIACVRNVREAWLVVARDPEAGKVLPRELRTAHERRVPPPAAVASAATGSSLRWSA